MAQIPGSVPLTGKVAPTDTTDTFATHIDIYGEGGYMTVADQAERDAITTERRKQGMAVFQNSTNEMYILQGGVANTNWTLFSGGGGDLQGVLEAGSQFVKPNGYQGGILSINYSGGTGNPSSPIINSTGILIDGNTTGTNNGENLMIATSGSADAAFVTLHAQNVNSLPVGPVPYSRLEVGQSDIVIDTNSTNWQNTSVGDVLTIKSVNPGLGTNGSQYVIGTGASTLTPTMQDVYNNSPQVITGLDTSKPLTLINGEINLDARVSATQTGIANLKGEGGTKIEHINPNLNPGFTRITQNTVGVKYSCAIASSGSFGGYRDIVVSEDEITITCQGSAPNTGDVLTNGGTGQTSYGTLEWQPGVQHKRVVVSSAEILNLGSTFKEIIPNPGVGKFIQIVSIYTKYDFGGTAYTGQNTDSIFIRYGAYGPGLSGYATVTLIPFAPVLNGTTNEYRLGNIGFGNGGPIDWKDNSNVELWMFSGNTLATGNGEVTIYASYIIKNL